MLQVPSFFGGYAHKESAAKQDLKSSVSTAVLPNLMGGRGDRAVTKLFEARCNAVSKPTTSDVSANAGNARCFAAVEQHIRALRGKKVSERYQAAETLATLGSNAQAAAPQLCQTLLEDDNALVRKSAATALGDLGVTTESVFADLRQAESCDEDQFVRQRARQALQTLGLLRSIANDIAFV